VAAFSSPAPPYGGSSGQRPPPQTEGAGYGHRSSCQIGIHRSLPSPGGDFGEFLVSGYIVGGPGLPSDEAYHFTDQPLSPYDLPATPRGQQWLAAWAEHVSRKRVPVTVAPPRTLGGRSQFQGAPASTPAGNSPRGAGGRMPEEFLSWFVGGQRSRVCGC
jgi:hypothetical protein